MLKEFLIDTFIVVFLGCLVGGFQHHHNGKKCDGHPRTEAQITSTAMANP